MPSARGNTSLKFGNIPVGQLCGAILAHSIAVDGKRLRKGKLLDASDVAALQEAGVMEAMAARLEVRDLGEDAAAQRVAAALVSGKLGLRVSAPFTGRVNIYSEIPGILDVDELAVKNLNSIHPAVTLATLPHLARVSPRKLAATVKIITYGVDRRYVEAAEEAAGAAIRLRGVAHKEAGLVVTEASGTRKPMAEKGIGSVRTRLAALGISLPSIIVTSHTADSVSEALAGLKGTLLLLLTGSATSDPADVGPEGLRRAGGKLERFGMPVDPGNLLFLGSLGSKPVIGLPGCARSPALNGADWVLERIACGVPVSGSDIASMGTGGLLKEIPARKQPRSVTASVGSRPVIEAAILGAEPNSVGRLAIAALESRLDSVRIVAQAADFHWIRKAADKRAKLVSTLSADGELDAMIRAAIAAAGLGADALLLIQPGSYLPSSTQLSRLAAAFSPADGREICKLAIEAEDSISPVLFGKRFFESLSEVNGGGGVSALIEGSAEFLVEISP